MKMCFMVGHRDANMDVYQKLEVAVNLHIMEHGIDEFIIGHYGNFDRMAARAVQDAKILHPKVKLTLLRPYLDDYPLPEGFDGSIYPDGLEAVPRRFAILQANHKIIECCTHVIVYVRYTFGGAYQCLEYARRKKKHILNINGDSLQ